MPTTSSLDATARCLAVRAAEYALLPGDAVFLNAAGYGPLPRRGLEALAALQHRRARAELGPGDFGELLQDARTEAARLVGADATEIALVPNTNVGINIAASIARQRRAAGDRRGTIIVSAGEFPANVYPWLSLERVGFRVRLVPTDAAGWPREAGLFEALDGPDVAVLALSAVQFATGWRAPLARFGEFCRARDILFAVDGIQAAGVLPIDVRADHIDVLASGAQKWLCSPFGTGFAFVRAPLARTWQPELPGWLAFGAAADFNRLCTYEYDLYDDARRFEVGTLPYPEFAAMAATLRLLNELGTDCIWEHVRELQQSLLDWAATRTDVTVTSPAVEPYRSGILCLRTADTAATFEQLVAADVACVLREGSIRLAPHFYNTPDELGRVVELLERAT